MATLEHANITVSDIERTAAELIELFDWAIRWKGEGKGGGSTIHVGGPENGDDYLAVYSPPSTPTDQAPTAKRGGLNHIGVLVDDIDDAERRVTALGYAPYNHGNYDPGRRFYFDNFDGIEFEVVSY